MPCRYFTITFIHLPVQQPNHPKIKTVEPYTETGCLRLFCTFPVCLSVSSEQCKKMNKKKHDKNTCNMQQQCKLSAGPCKDVIDAERQIANNTMPRTSRQRPSNKHTMIDACDMFQNTKDANSIHQANTHNKAKLRGTCSARPPSRIFFKISAPVREPAPAGLLGARERHQRTTPTCA